MELRVPDPPLPQDPGLRLAVWEVRRRAAGRRRFPARLHMGLPGGHEVSFDDDPRDRLDAHLRAEVAAALLSRALLGDDRPLAWLSRPGEPATHDVDLAWLAAASMAGGEAGLGLRFAVLTPLGWYDPVTLTGRRWRRLRVLTPVTPD